VEHSKDEGVQKDGNRGNSPMQAHQQ